MSAILIAKITIKDPDKFKEYVGKARETWMSAGAEALFRHAPGQNHDRWRTRSRDCRDL